MRGLGALGPGFGLEEASFFSEVECEKHLRGHKGYQGTRRTSGGGPQEAKRLVCSRQRK